jgi:hypothetical protein
MSNSNRARTRGPAANPAVAKAGQEIVRVVERVGNPAAEANRNLVYAKDVAGVTQLFAVASDGTVTQLTPTVGFGRLMREPQVRTASGAYNAPAGCGAIFVEAVGGGGGGGGATFSTPNMAFGGGGAGGSCGQSYFEIATEGTAFTVTIGAGGVGGTIAGGNGGQGGTTLFVSTLTGGLLSIDGGAGGGGMVAGAAADVAAGGISVPGSALLAQMGYGGDSGGNGIRLSGTMGVSGEGGGSTFGGGGGAREVQGGGGLSGGFGAGAGGTAAVSASAAGADGTDGVVRIWEYTS